MFCLQDSCFRRNDKMRCLVSPTHSHESGNPNLSFYPRITRIYAKRKKLVIFVHSWLCHPERSEGPNEVRDLTK
jgi:hypothetical protein